MFENNQYIERWRPELRMYENLMTEIQNFFAPEE